MPASKSKRLQDFGIGVYADSARAWRDGQHLGRDTPILLIRLMTGCRCACDGLGTRVFLWCLARSAEWARALTFDRFPVFALLPLALPASVWIIRTFAAAAVSSRERRRSHPARFSSRSWRRSRWSPAAAEAS
jgi:hypothetical protein